MIMPQNIAVIIIAISLQLNHSVGRKRKSMAVKEPINQILKSDFESPSIVTGKKHDIGSINNDLENIFYEEKVEENHDNDVLKEFEKKWVDMRAKLSRQRHRLFEDHTRLKTLEKDQQELLKRGQSLANTTHEANTESQNRDLRTNSVYFAAKDAVQKYKKDIETREEEMIAAEMNAMTGQVPQEVINLTISENEMSPVVTQKQGQPDSSNSEQLENSLDHLDTAQDVKRYFQGEDDIHDHMLSKEKQQGDDDLDHVNHLLSGLLVGRGNKPRYRRDVALGHANRSLYLRGTRIAFAQERKLSRELVDRSKHVSASRPRKGRVFSRLYRVLRETDGNDKKGDKNQIKGKKKKKKAKKKKKNRGNKKKIKNKDEEKKDVNREATSSENKQDANKEANEKKQDANNESSEQKVKDGKNGKTPERGKGNDRNKVKGKEVDEKKPKAGKDGLNAKTSEDATKGKLNNNKKDGVENNKGNISKSNPNLKTESQDKDNKKGEFREGDNTQDKKDGKNKGGGAKKAQNDQGVEAAEKGKAKDDKKTAQKKTNDGVAKANKEEEKDKLSQTWKPKVKSKDLDKDAKKDGTKVESREDSKTKVTTNIIHQTGQIKNLESSGKEVNVSSQQNKEDLYAELENAETELEKKLELADDEIIDINKELQQIKDDHVKIEQTRKENEEMLRKNYIAHLHKKNEKLRNALEASKKIVEIEKEHQKARMKMHPKLAELEERRDKHIAIEEYDKLVAMVMEGFVDDDKLDALDDNMHGDKIKERNT